MEKKSSLHGFLNMTIWVAITIVLIRLFEAVFMAYYYGDLAGHLLNNLLGVCFDIVYLGFVSIVLYVPFWFFSKYKNTLLVYRILYAIVMLISMLLVGYFSQAGVPLDRVFFMYSLQDIIEIISSSQTTVWWMYLCIVSVPVFFLLISKKELRINKITIVAALMVLITCAVIRTVFYDSSVNNNGYYEQSNKICYFLRSLFQNDHIVDLDDETNGRVLAFQSYFPENEFVSTDYPFLYKANDNNVLGRFFDLGDKKPNIVMIVVEGLGRENSGKYSKYLSTTPFLDSLAEHSLYWLNCMSVSQRTAGVFPALFGALPFGREGFMSYKRNAPRFNSLPKILNDNGYSFTIYYGGRRDFDNMDDFVMLNGGTWGLDDQQLSSDQRNEWGLFDKKLFEESIKKINFDSEKPRFDLYMTLTSHMPWDYPDRDYYMNEYSKMESAEGKQHYYDALSTAAYLYVDEALEQIFNAYRDKPGFDNTIFIITGDHNYYLYNYVLERYHVPLIIWSPLLKESRYFPAIVSHRDVPSTLISLLADKYDMAVPNEVAWLNNGLDTASVFQSTSFSPQMDASRNIVNMLYHEYYVDNGKVYKINYDDNKLKLEDDDHNKQIMALFKLYKALDKYVCDNDVLLKADNTITWSALQNHNTTTADTIFTDNTFPLEIVNVDLNEKYEALKVQFSFDMIFDKDIAQKGLSLGLVTAINDKKGNMEYYGCNEIRSFDELVKHYEFSEVMKRSNYNYSNDSHLKIYLYNWGNIKMGITNVQSDIDVSY